MFTVSLDQKSWEYILNTVAQRPYSECAKIIAEVTMQIERQARSASEEAQQKDTKKADK